MDSEFFNNSDSESESEGSDLDIDGEGDSFSSGTDSDDDTQTQETQSSLESFSSQTTDACDPDFWSAELKPVDISEFDEEHGPHHNLDPNDSILNYFYLMISEDFFDMVARETNRYAQQEAERRGSPDPEWSPTDVLEIKAYFGLCIFMGINQLPEIDMYWSENKFLGM